MNHNYIAGIIVGILMTGFAGYIIFDEQEVIAQSNPAARLIGGYTLGTGDTQCCNGTPLNFQSIDRSKPIILNGEALYTAGVDSNLHFQEQNSGHCTVGKLQPFICVDPEAECESADYMPRIVTIGTSESQCSGSAGFGAGAIGQ